MTRSGVLVFAAICGDVAGCRGGPRRRRGFLCSRRQDQHDLHSARPDVCGARDAYRRAWVAEGSAILEAMERGTGLTFLETHVNAVVYEGVSSSGAGDTPMYLRASYPADVKKATLVHEHGHRLIAQLRIRPADLDEHRVLDLFLYDVWESLWGRDFADQQVTIESGRTGLYDYKAAWNWALSISKAERASRFADIVKANHR